MGNKREYTGEKSWMNYVLEICPGIMHFVVKGVKVFVAGSDMNYPADWHAHNDIEFMCVKRQNLQNVYCDGKNLSIPQGYIMPFMPMQQHGVSKPVTIKQYIALAFPPEFYVPLSQNAALGAVEFDNIAFPPSRRLSLLVGQLFDAHCRKSSEYFMEKLLELIFIELFDSYKNFVGAIDSRDASVARARQFLDDNITMPFDLEQTARFAGMSKYHFSRKFKLEYGISPNVYLIKKKINKAKEMIEDGGKNLSEIAVELAFASQSHFTKVFKEEMGMTPSQYKKIILR